MLKPTSLPSTTADGLIAVNASVESKTGDSSGMVDQDPSDRETRNGTGLVNVNLMTERTGNNTGTFNANVLNNRTG